MIEDIVVYGTGGTSRDILEALEAINDDVPSWNLLGFLDDDQHLQGSEVMEYPVLGGGGLLASESSFRNCKVAIGIANDRNLLVRKTIRERLRLPDDRFPVVVHPSASVSPRSKVGAGSVLLSGAFCASLAVLGKHVLVLQNSVISHDVSIGSFVSIASNVGTGGNVQVGEGAYLGLGSVLLPHVKVGRQSRVGMGAVVIRNVPDFTTVVGNPAHEIPS